MNNPVSPPSLSVVIPTHDRELQLARLLDRLLADPEDFEVVVVNDRSSDGTAEMLRHRAANDHRLRVLHLNEDGSGPARARLAGAREARGTVLLMLDDDVMPDPGLPAGHRRHHLEHANALVAGYMPTRVPRPLRAGDFATLLYAQEYEARCRDYERDPETVLERLWLGNVSLPRTLYLEAASAGDVVNFTYRHEDRLLGFALRELGATPIFDRRLHGTHEYRRDLSAFTRDAYRQGAGRAALHLRRPDLVPGDPVEDCLVGMPRPLRAAAEATRWEPWRRVAVSGLQLGVRGIGQVGLVRGEIAGARLIRRIEQAHGARDVMSGRLPA